MTENYELIENADDRQRFLERYFKLSVKLDGNDFNDPTVYYSVGLNPNFVQDPVQIKHLTKDQLNGLLDSFYQIALVLSYDPALNNVQAFHKMIELIDNHKDTDLNTLNINESLAELDFPHIDELTDALNHSVDADTKIAFNKAIRALVEESKGFAQSARYKRTFLNEFIQLPESVDDAMITRIYDNFKILRSYMKHDRQLARYFNGDQEAIMNLIFDGFTLKMTDRSLFGYTLSDGELLDQRLHYAVNIIRFVKGSRVLSFWNRGTDCMGFIMKLLFKLTDIDQGDDLYQTQSYLALNFVSGSRIRIVKNKSGWRLKVNTSINNLVDVNNLFNRDTSDYDWSTVVIEKDDNDWQRWNAVLDVLFKSFTKPSNDVEFVPSPAAASSAEATELIDEYESDSISETPTDDDVAFEDSDNDSNDDDVFSIFDDVSNTSDVDPFGPQPSSGESSSSAQSDVPKADENRFGDPD